MSEVDGGGDHSVGTTLDGSLSQTVPGQIVRFGDSELEGLVLVIDTGGVPIPDVLALVGLLPHVRPGRRQSNLGVLWAWGHGGDVANSG